MPGQVRLTAIAQVCRAQDTFHGSLKARVVTLNGLHAQAVGRGRHPTPVPVMPSGGYRDLCHGTIMPETERWSTTGSPSTDFTIRGYLTELCRLSRGFNAEVQQPFPIVRHVCGAGEE